MAGVVAVLDVGKTNVKLEVFAPGGELLWERSIANRVVPGPPYPHADVEVIWTFLITALREANAAHPFDAIVPTTHACAGALVDEADLLLPVMDYEFTGVEEIEPLYAKLRPPYAETLSPPLPAGLNLGRQIAWQRQHFPEAFARAKHYLTYPQYWSWRLSGVAASEVTMLGSHTDLWAPQQGRPSRLAAIARSATPDAAAPPGLGAARRRQAGPRRADRARPGDAGAERRPRLERFAVAASRFAQIALHHRLHRHLGRSDGGRRRG